MVTKSTRERILTAAEQAILLGGSGGLRVDAVAQSAGVNKRMLYHYFGDKAGLIRAVYVLQAHRLVGADIGFCAESRQILRLLVADFLDHGRVPDVDVSPAELGQAVVILLPVLMRGKYLRDGLHEFTAQEWQMFAVEVISLGLADIAAQIFDAPPGSAEFQSACKRLLRPRKPLYRMVSTSRPR